MIEVIDSYYTYVKQQMGIVDAQQRFGPIIQARDWPQTPPLDSTLYLIVINASPIVPSTPSVMLYAYSVQWIWLVMGNDIQPNERKENRGDRYRNSFSMMKNLRDANFPGYCPKKLFEADASGVITSNGFTSYEVG